MGLWDFLKGILPDNLIKLNIDNRKIIINNSTITIGENTINSHKVIDKIFKKLNEYKDKETLPAQIIHKDLEGAYSDYEGITTNQKQAIKKLKTMLPEEEMACILMAIRVKLAYDRNNADLAKEIHKKLIENYPEKGNKVYNLVSAGYFDEMLIPFIDIFRSQYDNYIERYHKFYSDIIKFFPLAFFVGNGTTKDQIVGGIKDRFKLSVPFIRLHAIGDINIKKIAQVIDKMQINEKYVVNDNRFTSPNGLKAQILEIKVKR